MRYLTTGLIATLCLGLSGCGYNTIQTQDEASALMDLGVRYGQGYLYGRPHDPHAPRTRVVVAGPGPR